MPATRDGVEAAALLKAAGAPVTLTGLFAAHQALAAAAVGADYAAPYLGRIGGGGRDGRQEVVAMQAGKREERGSGAGSGAVEAGAARSGAAAQPLARLVP